MAASFFIEQRSPGQDNQPIQVQVEPREEGYQVTIGERTYQVQGQVAANGQLDLVIDGRRQRLYTTQIADGTGQQRLIWQAGQSWSLRLRDPQTRASGASSQTAGSGLTASMPGQVRAILVKQGDSVAAGDALVVLEAMKMEQRVSAPVAGTVVSINCAVGDVVQRGQLLVALGE